MRMSKFKSKTKSSPPRLLKRILPYFLVRAPNIDTNINNIYFGFVNRYPFHFESYLFSTIKTDFHQQNPVFRSLHDFPVLNSLFFRFRIIFTILRLMFFESFAVELSKN